jgi:hypothetical protein
MYHPTGKIFRGALFRGTGASGRKFFAEDPESLADLIPDGLMRQLELLGNVQGGQPFITAE